MYFIKTFDMKNYVLCVMGLLIIMGCSENTSDAEEKMKSKAVCFAEAYFNYDFKEAVRHVTPESVKWLQFAASNVNQADVDQLNNDEEAARVEVADFLYEDDSTVVVTVKVSDFLQKDSIIGSATMMDESSFPVTVVRRADKLFVKMEGLPRSERQSRD